MTRDWKLWATGVAYSCFLVLGVVNTLFFLLEFVLLDEGCSMGLAIFVLLPLDALLPLIALTGTALALILWREWPLLVLAAISVVSQLFLSPLVPFFDQIPLPAACTNHWTSGLCSSVVLSLSGVVLLFFSLRYFLFSQASGSEKRMVVIGIGTSALWTVLITSVNCNEIRASIAVIDAAGAGPQVQAASLLLRNLLGLIILVPLGWMAFATIRALGRSWIRVSNHGH